MSAVSLLQRGVAHPADTADAGEVAASPPARRTGTARWRDPRLWLGALLVLASVVIGARVLAAADNTVPVWTLDHAVSAGMAVDTSDLGVTRVHFGDLADQSRYWLADESIPQNAHTTHDLGAGEMLPRSAVSTDGASLPAQLPLGVTAAGLPTDLVAGDHVQVWAVPKPEDRRRHSELVLNDAAVLSVAEVSVTGLGGDRQVVVALSQGTATSAVLDALNGATVVLIRISG